MPDEAVKLLILGAHPDDAEYHAGALAASFRQLGRDVKMVSVTNGAAGHHRLSPEELVAVRRDEAAAAGRVIGAEYVTWDFPDGELEVSLELRRRIIGEIRSFRPDLVLTHRTCDYHPDHRAVGQAVQDASFMVTVPHVVPRVPALRRDPVVAYMVDEFTKPAPLEADVVIDAGEHVETIVDMLMCQRSQVLQWLPYNRRIDDQVPRDPAGQRRFVRDWYVNVVRRRAERYRDALVATYGEDRGRRIELCEVYEVSEYAAPLDEMARRRLFPFLP